MNFGDDKRKVSQSCNTKLSIQNYKTFLPLISSMSSHQRVKFMETIHIVKNLSIKYLSSQSIVQGDLKFHRKDNPTCWSVQRLN